jgi:hypothetical protein
MRAHCAGRNAKCVRDCVIGFATCVGLRDLQFPLAEIRLSRQAKYSGKYNLLQVWIEEVQQVILKML